MIRQKRPVVALLVIAFFCILFLFKFLGSKNTNNNEVGAITTKKTDRIRDERGDTNFDTKKLPENHCVWSPEDPNTCKYVIARRLQNSPYPHRRWLFLGDSTMAQLWATSSLNEIMVDFGVSRMNEVCSRRFVCEPVFLEDCNLNQQYNLPTVAEWKPPDWEVVGEGPASLVHPECFGCKNCVSHFPAFSLIDETRHCRANQKLSYGGYIAIPYARDVVLQTPSYGTTQENILQYVDHHWNNEILHEEFGGHPVCVVRTGVHDIAIPKMSASKYAANVKWYLQLLKKQCYHVVWLQNTAPLAKDNEQPQYPQTVERVREYDLAVLEMAQQEFQEFVTTMDVFDASRDWQHADNIHLDSEWNRALGMFFVKLATKVGDKQ